MANTRGKASATNGKPKVNASIPDAFIPPPIPDEQNFAAIPFFASMFAYDRDPKIDPVTALFSLDATRWHDSEAYKRTQFNIYGSGMNPSTSWNLWQTGKAYDLETWQKHYRNDTNFPAAAAPQNPAGDVLLALTKFDGILDEVRAASVRTNARFPVHYNEGPAAMLPHLNALRNLSRLLSLRAISELRLGNNDQAFADVKLGFRLAESIKSEPLFISQLVHKVLIDILLQPVWEGLAEHRWSNEQLNFFQAQLAAIDFLEDAEHSMKRVRAEAGVLTLAELRTWDVVGARVIAAVHGH